MFKGYKKLDTSKHNMLRIDKRERILGLAVTCGHFVGQWPAEGNFQICGSDQYPDVFEWKMNLIKEAGWLDDPLIGKHNNGSCAVYDYSSKLRIYYNWTHYGPDRRRSCLSVLKYMYSPLFAAMMVISWGKLSPGGCMILQSSLSHEEATMIQCWLWDILEVRCEVCEEEPYENAIYFFKTWTERLLELIDPIMKEMPSVYKDFYKEGQDGKYCTDQKEIVG